MGALPEQAGARGLDHRLRQRLKEWRGREIPPSEVSGLMKEVELLQLASHLYWALWGVLQVRQA